MDKWEIILNIHDSDSSINILQMLLLVVALDGVGPVLLGEQHAVE